MDSSMEEDEEAIRTEPSLTISEHRLSRVDGKEASVEKVISSAKKFKNASNLKAQIAKAHKRHKLLKTPLHRQAEERLRRSVAYNEECKELKDWDEFVRLNRVIDKASFPLTEEDGSILKLFDKEVQRSQPRTELEIELAQAKQGETIVDKDNGLSEQDEQLLRQMGLDEAEEALSRLRRFRALQTYQESKNRRHKKIKSKRYHRILKQQQRRRLLKEFQNLISTDPKAAVEKLELLEKDRIVERATLRHHGTNTWARKMMTYARRDIRVREKIQEQIRFSKELITKLGHANELAEDAPAESDDEEAMLLQNAADDDDHQVDRSAQPSTSAFLKVDGQVAPVILEDQLVVDFGGQEALMAEAFEDDDVVAEFEQQRSAKALHAAKSVEPGLPGWNFWIGPGTRFTERQGKGRPPNPGGATSAGQATKGHSAVKGSGKTLVVFNENACRSIREKQVNAVPFPFLSNEAYERAVANPVGREWNPSTAFSVITESAVTTKMGRIIGPANRNLLASKRPAADKD